MGVKVGLYQIKTNNKSLTTKKNENETVNNYINRLARNHELLW